MFNDRLDLLTDYPFQRLTALLAGIEPDAAAGAPMVMSIGEPQHAPPAFVPAILTEQAAGWGKYPPMAGTPDFRSAVADWLTRRFSLPEGMVQPDRHVVPVAGTREALYMIAQVVCATSGERPVVLMPNPFYQVYYGAAVMAGAEPVLVPAGPETGFLPDFTALPQEVLSRTALAYLCTPGNPQGAVASREMLEDAIKLARIHGFVLAMDECYSEIYDSEIPAGSLEACAALGGSMDKVVIFHSLSKRSSAPGLRSGFVAGDAEIIARFSRLRAYGGAALPLPILAASTALWRDEAHVEENRRLYRAKFDAAEKALGHLPGFRRPAGGFFLWLDVEDGEKATQRLWREAAIRVLPGAYLAREDKTGYNPGTRYIRVALVHDLDRTAEALDRMAKVL